MNVCTEILLTIELSAGVRYPAKLSGIRYAANHYPVHPYQIVKQAEKKSALDEWSQIRKKKTSESYQATKDGWDYLKYIT
jgi:hypothetical protein